MNDIFQSSVNFVLFGGKGGVGKTTMAASSAIQYAKAHSDKKILLFTTDPAPSLGDSMGQSLSHEPTQIKGVPNLWGMEIDANIEMENFKKIYGDDILDVLQQGTYLSDEETEEMFSLDIPGLDEVMGLKKIMDYMGTATGQGTRKSAEENASKRGSRKNGSKNPESFDMYILDTAPTGHTLRLLALPELLDNWVKFLATLRWKYHYMQKSFTRSKESIHESADNFLLEMKKTVKKVREVLSDSSQTTFVVVMVPEAMVIAETEDLLKDLKQLKIPVRTVIMNHVLPNDESEFVRTKRHVQQKYIQEFTQAHPKLHVVQVEEQMVEVAGIDTLKNL
jgi:arsenite/tail-anchored protein-transporting ATPase